MPLLEKQKTVEQVVGSVFMRAFCVKCELSDRRLQYGSQTPQDGSHPGSIDPFMVLTIVEFNNTVNKVRCLKNTELYSGTM